MDYNKDESYKDPELVNKGSVGKDNDDYMGGKDDIFIDRIRKALIQRKSPTHPNYPRPILPKPTRPDPT